MAIVSLAQLGRVQKEVVINKDLKIKLHTLSVAEMQKSLASIPSTTVNDMERMLCMQQSVLAFATDEVNGQAVTSDEAKQIYADAQSNLLAEIFVEYTSLAEDQAKVLEDLKKK